MNGDDKKDDGQTVEGGWQYKGEAGAQDALTPIDVSDIPVPSADSGEAVEWTASEFVAHEKNFGWYALLLFVSIVVAGGLYFVTRDVFSAGVVIVIAIIMAIAAAHKPRQVAYRLDGSGITAGKNFHPYSDYKSFAMPEEGPFVSIVLVPMKRFGLPLSAYLAPDTQDKALNLLSNYLPLERGELDNIEKLMRQLRF